VLLDVMVLERFCETIIDDDTQESNDSCMTRGIEAGEGQTDSLPDVSPFSRRAHHDAAMPLL